jgi:two-component system, chemotaxis family, CheB/CheR fusion protein
MKKVKPVSKKKPGRSNPQVKSSRAKVEKVSADVPFPIVGIGASAGGLEALESFFKNMPDACNMAFVVIQHLDPTRKGIMPELLQRFTMMEVVSATDNLKVKANCIYVMPSNKSMSIAHRSLHLFEPVETRGLRLPIDFFFCSLADDMHEQSIGIILSGMGSDGSVGLRAIKEKSGLAMVQEPESSKFDSMPRSAIDAVSVDFIAPANELPARLMAFLGHRQVIKPVPDLPVKDISALKKIVALLQINSGHDFSHYKKIHCTGVLKGVWMFT